MIPITVRLLGTQGKPSFINSFVYASGIVVTYSLIGTMAALSGGLFGSLLANVWVNLIFGVLFASLGLSMLGFADFSKLQNFGSKLGAGKQSLANTFFMGAGAGLVAAPCTGPILGALIVFAARQENPQDAIALFPVYSAGFGLPYIFLGMAASKVSNVKVSPRIQLFIKMLFAAIMFALALFYVKTPAYQMLKPLQGYWRAIALSLTVAGLAIGHLVFNNAKMSMNKFMTVIPSVVLGIGLFAQSQWLSGADLISKIDWIKSEETALQVSMQRQKPNHDRWLGRLVRSL